LARASQRVANGIDRDGRIIYAKFTHGEREKAYNVPGPAQLPLLPLTLYLDFFTALARHFVSPSCANMNENSPDELSHTLRERGAHYVVDTQGHPVAVLLTLEEYEHYLDLLDDEADSQDDELASNPPTWRRLYPCPT
jgi:hypothetical protein